MGSRLRVRSSHHRGLVPSGLIYQHSYELAHMVLESEDEANEEEVVWTDDLMHKFFDLSLPDIKFVERVGLYFSCHFNFRLCWPSCNGMCGQVCLFLSKFSFQSYRFIVVCFELFVLESRIIVLAMESMIH